jgi:hypothetical protein
MTGRLEIHESVPKTEEFTTGQAISVANLENMTHGYNKVPLTN